jgi:hypothetical protein
VLHAWSFLTDSETGVNSIRPRSLDFEFTDVASSLPISLLRTQDLQFATDPDPIYVKCDRCSSVSVAGKSYERTGGFFVIPFAELAGSIDAVCANTSAAFCRITDGRFAGSMTKLARFSADGGLMNLTDDANTTPLFPGVTRQILTGNAAQSLQYEKIWAGDVEFADLAAGSLVYEIEPVTWKHHKAAYVRAFLANVSVPFSPVRFLDGTTAAFEAIGISVPDSDPDEDVVVSNYLPDGELVANLDHFVYSLGSDAKAPPVLVDVPEAFVKSVEFRCSQDALVENGRCVAKATEQAGPKVGVVIGISVVAVVVVAVVIAVGVYLVQRRESGRPQSPAFEALT